MLRLLRHVSLREHRAHAGRAFLIVAGVAVGIALMVAFDVMNASVIDGFRQTFAALAGPADLEVTLGVGEVGFPEELADIVRADQDVATVVPLVRGAVVLGDDPSDTVQLFGAELTAEDDLARYGVHLASARRDALQALTDPHAILVAEALARRLHLDVGSTLRLATPLGLGTFTIRALLTSEGVARVLGGQLVVLDLAAAQRELVKDARIDQLDVVLRRGADAVAVRARLQAALPSTLTVAAPQNRAGRYEEILASLQAVLMGLSLLCVLAGLFIVYNASATGVLHRAPTIGMLRIVGGESRQLRRLLLLEATALGAVGALFGVLIGVVLARVLLAYVGTVIGTMVQMRFFVPTLTFSPLRAVGAAALGIGVAFAAAWFPARQATRADPLIVISDEAQDPAHAPTRVLALVCLALLALAFVTLLVDEQVKNPDIANAGATLWNGAALVGGILGVLLARRPILRWVPRLFGVTGTVAAANVVRTPVRSGVTVAAIGMVATIAVALGSTVASYLTTAEQYVMELNDGDLAVSAVATEGGWLETPITPAVADEIARVPGVRRVEPARIVPGQPHRGWRVGLLALAPERLARTGPALWREGDRVSARDAIADGSAFAVSTSFVDRFHVRVGETLDVETPTGAHSLPIAGVVADMTSNSGTIVLSRALYERWWRDPSVTRINVYLEPGVPVEDARSRIVAALGDRYRLKVLTLRDNIEYFDRKIRDAFAFVNALQIVVVIVTIAGIFDLLVSGIIERRRELAVWRLIGASDATVRRTIVVESITIGAVAVAFGLLVGMVTSWIYVRIVIHRMIGYDLLYAFAGVRSAASLAVILIVTALAGRAAATRATRASILDALRAH